MTFKLTAIAPEIRVLYPTNLYANVYTNMNIFLVSHEDGDENKNSKTPNKMFKL